MMNSDTKRILVTGPDGFVGSALCAALLKQGFVVCGAQWQKLPLPNGCESVIVGDIDADTDWSLALEGIDTVVHLAARVHVMKDTATEPLEEYRKVNVAGTRRLAECAAQAGVRRFILMSTIKVNGEETGGGRTTVDCRLKTEDRWEKQQAESTKQKEGYRPAAFTEGDSSAPEDAYGISKWEAECALQEIAAACSMETVILRAPLIYGPGVKGNMQSLMKLASCRLPLPLGAVDNRRSLLYVGNLADFISRCIDHPAAANELFLLSDNHDLSTTELLRAIREGLQMRPLLIPVPVSWFQLAGRLSGKTAVVKRLFGSLQVDCGKAMRLLDWQPPVSVQDGITAMLPKAQQKDAVPRTGDKANMVNFRFFDVLFALGGMVAGLPFLVIIAIAGLFDTGSPFFLQRRVGRNRNPFTLVKFRTMKRDTVSVGTHLADASAITPLGRILRRTKLDELPQLWNVVKGDMSLVGPRPCLFNQEELIAERDARGVYEARPGITGLAQINDIDMSTPRVLAEMDANMLQNLTFINYFRYILATVFGKGAGDRVRNKARVNGTNKSTPKAL